MTVLTCPHCAALWNPARDRFLCGADERGEDCVPATEVAVNWCRAHGIEPVRGDRRSAQALRCPPFRVATVSPTVHVGGPP
jgi:hypothetical protein